MGSWTQRNSECGAIWLVLTAFLIVPIIAVISVSSAIHSPSIATQHKEVYAFERRDVSTSSSSSVSSSSALTVTSSSAMGRHLSSLDEIDDDGHDKDDESPSKNFVAESMDLTDAQEAANQSQVSEGREKRTVAADVAGRRGPADASASSDNTSMPLDSETFFTWTPGIGTWLLVLLLTFACVHRLIGILRLRRVSTTLDSNSSSSSSSSASYLSWTHLYTLLFGVSAQRSRSGVRYGPIHLTIPDTVEEELNLSPTRTARKRLQSLSIDSSSPAPSLFSLTSSAADGKSAADWGVEMANFDLSRGVTVVRPNIIKTVTAPILLSDKVVQELVPNLPPLCSLKDLKLLYHNSTHGSSLSEFYRRVAGENDILLLFRDLEGSIFGCFTASGWSIQHTYFGSPATAVFTVAPSFRFYRATLSNSYYQLAREDYLAVGGGDHFSIWVDQHFRDGQTMNCATFESQALANKQRFVCVDVEAWAFV